MTDNPYNDELTENGILSDHPDVTMADYRDLHEDPVIVTDETVIFADRHGHELNEWADALDMDRHELSEKMHELARENDTPMATRAPVAFDARTFEE